MVMSHAEVAEWRTKLTVDQRGPTPGPLTRASLYTGVGLGTTDDLDKQITCLPGELVFTEYGLGILHNLNDKFTMKPVAILIL